MVWIPKEPKYKPKPPNPHNTPTNTPTDLISRQDALDAFNGNIMVTGRENANEVRSYIKETVDKIMALPSADRPTGEWVLKEHLWECDQCGCRINRAKPLKGNIWNYNFCPNCGAKMGGVE